MWLVPSKEWLSKGKEDWESLGSYHCNVLCSIVQIVRLTITFWRNQNLELKRAHRGGLVNVTTSTQILTRKVVSNLTWVLSWPAEPVLSCQHTTFTFTQV